MSERIRTVELAFSLGAEIGECPVWDDQRSELLVIDIPSGVVHQLAPSGSRLSFNVGDSIGSLGLRVDGGLVLAVADRFALCDADGSNIEPVDGLRLDREIEHFNDGKPDPWGNFIAGSRHVPRTSPVCSLYSLSSSGAVGVLRRDVQSSNGLAWSGDARTLYDIDSAISAIDSFTVEDGGSAVKFRERLAVYETPGAIFDGMTIDEDDCLWVCCYRAGQVRRYSPTGQVDLVVEVPTNRPTSCAFGGSRWDQLFITTASRGMTESDLESDPHAGDVFVYESPVRGRPPDRFAGSSSSFGLQTHQVTE